MRVVNYTYNPQNELADQLVLCFQIFFVTLEFFLQRDLLESLTEDKGETLKSAPVFTGFFLAGVRRRNPSL